MLSQIGASFTSSVDSLVHRVSPPRPVSPALGTARRCYPPPSDWLPAPGQVSGKICRITLQENQQGRGIRGDPEQPRRDSTVILLAEDSFRKTDRADPPSLYGQLFSASFRRPRVGTVRLPGTSGRSPSAFKGSAWRNCPSATAASSASKISSSSWSWARSDKKRRPIFLRHGDVGHHFPSGWDCCRACCFKPL